MTDLSSIKTWTDKQIAEFVFDHLERQAGPAMSTETAWCMYRAPDGKRCAVGCLIPDAAYDPKIEGLGISRQRVKAGQWATVGGIGFSQDKLLSNVLNAAGIPARESTFSLLQFLQSVHDSNDFNWYVVGVGALRAACADAFDADGAFVRSLVVGA